MDVAKVFFIKMASIYGTKWNSQFTDDVVKKIAFEEWKDALKGINERTVEETIKHFRNTSEWPPSISEFLKECNKANGVPDERRVMMDALRRDFSHPITKIIFDEIGSWAFTHDSSKDLEKKVRDVYGEHVNELLKKGLLNVDSVKVLRFRDRAGN